LAEGKKTSLDGAGFGKRGQENRRETRSQLLRHYLNMSNRTARILTLERRDVAPAFIDG